MCDKHDLYDGGDSLNRALARSSRSGSWTSAARALTAVNSPSPRNGSAIEEPLSTTTVGKTATDATGGQCRVYERWRGPKKAVKRWVFVRDSQVPFQTLHDLLIGCARGQTDKR